MITLNTSSPVSIIIIYPVACRTLALGCSTESDPLSISMNGTNHSFAHPTPPPVTIFARSKLYHSLLCHSPANLLSPFSPAKFLPGFSFPRPRSGLDHITPKSLQQPHNRIYWAASRLPQAWSPVGNPAQPSLSPLTYQNWSYHPCLGSCISPNSNPSFPLLSLSICP